MGSCYWFATGHRSSFIEAERYCKQQFNSHVVHIESYIESRFVNDFLRKLDDQNWWLGASDEAVEGVWKWYGTNTTLPGHNWYPGTPDNFHNNEDCAILANYGNFQWDDVPCSSMYEPICELKSVDVVPVGK